MSPDDATIRLLFALARSDPDEAAVARALAAGIDVKRFVRMVGGHCVIGPVHRALGRIADPSALALRQHLEAAATTARHRALAVTMETVRIVRALEAEGVPVLVLKGAVEGALARGSPALRHAGDVDVFVPEGEASARAAAVLIARGLTPVSPALLPAAGARWLQPPEIAFRRDQDSPVVELQWRFASPFTLFPLSVAAAWERRVTATVAGAAVPTLPPAERLLYLCVHGAGHGWTRLNWLVDIAENLRRHDGIGDEAAARAAAMELQRPYVVACHLAARLLGAPLPQRCPPLDTTGGRLLAAWTASLMAPPDADTRRGWRRPETKLATDLALCRGLAAKGRVLASRLLPRVDDIRESPGVHPARIVLRRLIRLALEGPRPMGKRKREPER